MCEDGKLVVTTPATTVKAKNVSRDPRVTLLVDDGETYVMIKGKAAFSGRDSRRDLELLATKYEGAEAARRIVPELMREGQVSIEITPMKVVSQNV